MPLSMLPVFSFLILKQPWEKQPIFQVIHWDSEQLGPSGHINEDMAESEFKPGSFGLSYLISLLSAS